MRGIRKRIVMIAFCDSGGGAVTRRTVPAGRPAAGEAGQEPGGHAPGPFGIFIFPRVRGGQRAAGQHPGRRVRCRLPDGAVNNRGSQVWVVM